MLNDLEFDPSAYGSLFIKPLTVVRAGSFYLSFEWNSIRLGGPAHGIVTKTVHITLPGGCGGRGWWGSGWWGSGVVGVGGGGGQGWWG